MTTIWFIIIAVIGQDGKVYTDIRWPLDPNLNNQVTCLQNGPLIAQQYEQEYPNGLIHWRCTGISVEELSKGLTKSGGGI